MARIAIACICLLASFGAGWFIGRNDNAARVDWLEKELADHAAAAEKRSHDQFLRSQQINALSRTVAAYDAAVASGAAAGCAADPVYTDRLRDILSAQD